MISHKRSEFIVLSYGEYSDFRYNGVYRCLHDMDMAELVHAYNDQCPSSKYDWGDGKDASVEGFAAWLTRGGHVEEIDFDEIHCGSYSIHCGSYSDFEVDAIATWAADRAGRIAEH